METPWDFGIPEASLDSPNPVPTPSPEEVVSAVSESAVSESADEIYKRMRFWLFLLVALIATAVLHRVDYLVALGVGYLICAAEEEFAGGNEKDGEGRKEKEL